MILAEQKGTRMAEDGKDWNELETMILKTLAIFFSNYTNDDVAPLMLLFLLDSARNFYFFEWQTKLSRLYLTIKNTTVSWVEFNPFFPVFLRSQRNTWKL